MPISADLLECWTAFGSDHLCGKYSNATVITSYHTLYPISHVILLSIDVDDLERYYKR
jgi:hypothetical protein